MATAAPARPAQALSIDVELADRVQRHPFRAVVHSAFDRAVNVLSADGAVTTLCAGSLDDAPRSVRVDVARWARTRWAPGRPVVVTGRGVRFAGEPALEVRFDTPDRWRTVAAPLPSDGLEGSADALAGLVTSLGVPGGARIDEAQVDPFAAAVALRVRDGVEAIVRGERGDDRDAVSVAVAGLLGLGPGLTPTGDDVLTGIALLAAQPASRIRHVGAAIVAELDRRPDATTVVARATLREAARGRARQSLMTLLGVLAMHGAESVHRPALLQAARQVIGIGHTSGTDILSGIAAGLRLERELRDRE